MNFKKQIIEMLESNNVSDMTEKEENIIKFILLEDYENQNEDIEYLENKLEEHEYNHGSWNLQTVYDIVSSGDWYYNNPYEIYNLKQIFGGKIVDNEQFEEIELNEFVTSIECLGTSSNYPSKYWYSVEFVNGEDMDIYYYEEEEQ